MGLDAERLDRIEGRLEQIEAVLSELCKALRSPTNPLYISLDTAAGMLGRSKLAVAKLIQRERHRMHGLKIRRLRGTVNCEDFRHLIKRLEARQSKGRGELIRNAVREVV